MTFKTVFRVCAMETGLIDDPVRTWGCLCYNIHYALFLINLNQGQKTDFFSVFPPSSPMGQILGNMKHSRLFPGYLRSRI